MKKTLFLLLMLTTVANAQTHDLYANDGTYLGNTGNQYDTNSINNPYGRYGSKYSNDSVNNPYGNYGSKYSNNSPNNPYAKPAKAVNWNNNSYRCIGGNGYGC